MVTRFVRAGLVLLLLAVSAPQAAAQPARLPPLLAMRPGDADAERLLTSEVIETRRKQVESAADLDEATKKRALDLYLQAAESLARAADAATRAELFRQQVDSVPRRLQQAQQRMEEVRGHTDGPLEGLDLAALEPELAQADRRLAELRQTQTQSDSEFTARAHRRREVRNALFACPQRLQDIDRQMEAPAPRDEPAAVTLARRSELLARRMLIEAEIPALQNELARYDAEDSVDLLRHQRDLNIQELALAEQRFRLLDTRVRQLRQVAADLAVRQADEEVFDTLPLLRNYAERNVELAAEAQNLTRLIGETDQELQAVQAELDEVSRLFNQARDLVDRIGLTRTVGAQLRKQRADLPNVRNRYQNLRQRQQLIEDAHFGLFQLDQQRSELAQPDLIVARILHDSQPGRDAAESVRVQEAAERAVDRKRQYLDTLIRNQRAYFDALSTLDTTEQQLVQLTEAYVAYINERVLWIRSARPLTAGFALSETDWWIVSPAQWAAVAATLGNDVRQNPNVSAAAAALLALLLVLRRRARRRIEQLGELAQRRNCTQFRLTLKTTAYTAWLSAPWPVITWYLSWRLMNAAEATDFARAVGIALWVQACVFLPVELLRQICRPHGLAESHFDWPESALHPLRANLLGWALLAAPLGFATTVLYAADPEQGYEVLERVLFCLGCLLTALLLSRILRPVGGVLHEYNAFHRDGWLDRLKHLWYALGIAAPLAPAALAFFGYSYTAQQLTVRLFFTTALIVLLIVVRSFLLRLLLVHRRHLSMRQARERRAAAMSALRSDSAGGTPSRTIIPVDEGVDLAQLSSQTQRIVTTGVVVAALLSVWGIWDGAIPALKILDNWTLWTTVVLVTETTIESGAEVNTTREAIQRVTVADLLLASLVVIITLIAFRNIPGLMEIAVLQRLPLEPSVRYAITALSTYAIIMIGGVFACSTLGLRWSQIQWLATALTFGLAFGLQEMFANFVAGLIILFERPIRVGDVVTVADVTGVVSRVRIRATTITNWDRKEFVVPNKEFITGRLLNWTLSDKINRITVQVGVAYGSDTDQVRQLLLKAAKEHPLLLDNPEPIAAFEGFGDSSLNFTLRVFLPTLENRLNITHDLHTAIYKALCEAGIGIPFPQRELHVRSAPPPLTSLPGYVTIEGLTPAATQDFAT